MPIQEFTTEELAGEEWRPVVGYENRYSVSSLGRIRSNFDPTRPARSPIIMSPRNKRGYLLITLCSENGRRTFFVHRIVASAFIGPSPEGYQVNHKDASKSNNRVPNLEYVTLADNIRHAFSMGLMKAPPHGHPASKGATHWKAKLVDGQIREMRKCFAAGQSISSIARLCNLSTSTVKNIVYHIRWKHVA